ncbi:hypothetical protein A0257_07700 [Hymenobacter psoromatis]|nr:hypothetical protein A0257_07700 [Hymenobacter psoromatis]
MLTSTSLQPAADSQGIHRIVKGEDQTQVVRGENLLQRLLHVRRRAAQNQLGLAVTQAVLTGP